MFDAISVRAAGDYEALVAGAPPDVRRLAKEVTGKEVRRIGRFIQLGLVGAARCIGAATLPPDTAVYLSSRRGDLEVTIEVMESLFRDGHAPKPLSFINTVSNAACFYIARNFALHGRSCFVGGAYFSFESALDLALLEVRAGVVRSALVGVVEIITDPVAIHRRRLGLPPDAPIAEASHWLWLQRDASEGEIGSLGAVEFFESADDLFAWWRRAGSDPARTAFAPGQFLGAEQAAAIHAKLGLGQVFNYRAERGYYDGQSGAVVGAFLREQSGTDAVLHVNADASGRLAAIYIERR
jgi:hypothetical protein